MCLGHFFLQQMKGLYLQVGQDTSFRIASAASFMFAQLCFIRCSIISAVDAVSTPNIIANVCQTYECTICAMQKELKLSSRDCDSKKWDLPGVWSQVISFMLMHLAGFFCFSHGEDVFISILLCKFILCL